LVSQHEPSLYKTGRKAADGLQVVVVVDQDNFSGLPACRGGSAKKNNDKKKIRSSEANKSSSHRA